MSLIVPLVIILAVISATGCQRTEHRYVASPERGTVTLWDSASSEQACRDRATEELDRVRYQTEGVQPSDLPPRHEYRACEAGKLGELTHDTEVEMIASNALCGSLEPVRVSSGKLAGQVGCLSEMSLRPR